MQFLINLLIIVALIVGAVYFFFRDTAFVAAVLPQQLGKVPAHESVRLVFLRRVDIAMTERESTDTPVLSAVYYQEAVNNKFLSLSGGGSTISRDAYMSAKQAEFAAYVATVYDANGNGSVEKSEWPADEIFALNALDKDKSGALTAEEFWTKGRKEALDAFTKADRNGDASLTKEEYYAGLGGDKGAEDLAISVDSNGNGAVNLDEIRFARHNAQQHWQP